MLAGPNMPHGTDLKAAGEIPRRRLFVYNGGFLTNRRVRRILSLAGYDIKLGRPSKDDLVAIWGQSPTAHRGAAVAHKSGAPRLFVEDALLRSILPGRAGTSPMGLFLDQKGVHFDPAQPSDLEEILAKHPLDDTALLDRARGAIERIKNAHLSKYSGNDPELDPPAPGYVLVIDQTRGDASVTASGANEASFREMLVFAQEEHPGCKVIIKTHPETAQGFRQGYFGADDENHRVTLLTDNVSPWRLFEGAVGVYTVSSQMGFEAIFAGHKPRVFGQPFYAGWGLTADENPVPRRARILTRAQIFAAAMILYPLWYDVYHDKLCTLEEALDGFEAQTRAWREDHVGWVAHGMRMWKRAPLQKFFGSQIPLRFDHDNNDPNTPRRHMVWGTKPAPVAAVQVEDGFLRSRGLGAELVPPLSLVCDDLGIYYDPTRKSRLEAMIAQRRDLRPDQKIRTERLIARIRTASLSKYNLAGKTPNLPEGRTILVPGQVEDDASIQLGAGDICTNAQLLDAVRTANPEAVVIYKPHPDVVAGLRVGAVKNATHWADLVLEDVDIATVLEHVDEVWTMTSLTGFEALIRGCKTYCYGSPFYSGWGLTTDLGRVPARRQGQVSLVGLAHATLIDYPRYFDPVTSLPCSAEVVVERLATGQVLHPGLINRMLSKGQGMLASYSRFWRK